MKRFRFETPPIVSSEKAPKMKVDVEKYLKEQEEKLARPGRLAHWKPAREFMKSFGTLVDSFDNLLENPAVEVELKNEFLALVEQSYNLVQKWPNEGTGNENLIEAIEADMQNAFKKLEDLKNRMEESTKR